MICLMGRCGKICGGLMLQLVAVVRHDLPAAVCGKGRAQRGDVEIAAEALLQPLQLRLELEACANQLEELWRGRLPHPLLEGALLLQPNHQVREGARREVGQRLLRKGKRAAQKGALDARRLLEVREGRVRLDRPRVEASRRRRLARRLGRGRLAGRERHLVRSGGQRLLQQRVPVAEDGVEPRRQGCHATQLAASLAAAAPRVCNRRVSLAPDAGDGLGDGWGRASRVGGFAHGRNFVLKLRSAARHPSACDSALALHHVHHGGPPGLPPAEPHRQEVRDEAVWSEVRWHVERRTLRLRSVHCW
mmetsp:Transcript_43539/g.141268  ORF Transcript_43539/g.141268 Transcript_43539/m.141268 type:complete len:305 (-) Transcript_43539:37-951(-)